MAADTDRPETKGKQYSVPWPAHRLLEDNALLATHVNSEDLITEHGVRVR